MRSFQEITAARETARAKLAELRDEGLELSELKAQSPEQWTDGVAERATRIAKGIEHAEARLTELDGEYRNALSEYATAHPEALEGPGGTAGIGGIRGLIGGARASYKQPMRWGEEFMTARSGMRAAVFDSGSVPVTSILSPTPIVEGREARFMYELIPSSEAAGGQFSFLRQTVRTNNAAVVEVGGLKPESVFTLVRVDDRTEVIAHVTEPVDRFLVEDTAVFTQFLNGELVYGLSRALDEHVKDEILAVAAPSGTANLAGVRDAITDLQELDLPPTGIVMSPASWASIEGEIETSFSANPLLSPLDATRQSLYGVAVQLSTAFHTAILIGDFRGSAHLYRTGGARIDVHDSAPRTVGELTVPDYRLNQLVFRAELRAEIAVTRPSGFVAIGTGS